MAGNANSGNRHKDKPFKDALALVAKAAEAEGRGLRTIAEKLFALAETGDMQAIKEIGDRFDGKPAQAVVGGDDDDNPINILATIQRVIIDAQSTD